MSSLATEQQSTVLNEEFIPSNQTTPKQFVFEWISQRMHVLKNKDYLNYKNLIMMATFVILAVFFITQVMLHSPSKSELKKPSVIQPTLIARSDATLADIQTKLAMIEQQLNQQNTASTLKPMTAQLGSLHQTLVNLQQKNRQQMNEQLAKDNAATTGQIQALRNELATLRQLLQRNQVMVLKPEALPFRVTAIDMIQGQAVVTLQYDYKSFPIQKGDSIAGWQLNQVDYAQQKAEFIDSKQQHVLIDFSHP